MRKILLIASLVGVGIITGFYTSELLQRKIRPFTRFTFADHLSDPKAQYLTATGTWSGKDYAYEVNVVRLSCYRPEAKCEVHQAEIKDVSGPTVDIGSTDYKISQLSDTVLMAESDDASLCVRETLIIDRKSKSVSIVTGKKSNEGICSMVSDRPMTLTLIDGWKASSSTTSRP